MTDADREAWRADLKLLLKVTELLSACVLAHDNFLADQSHENAMAMAMANSEARSHLKQMLRETRLLQAMPEAKA